MMAWWEYFEQEFLDKHGVGAKFTNRHVAADCGVDPTDGSAWIQLYLQAQRGVNSRTKYLLHRTGQTRASYWTTGSRTQDAREIVGQLGDDTARKITRAVVPDLKRVMALNPRAVHAIETQLRPMVDGFMQMVAGVAAAIGQNNSTP